MADTKVSAWVQQSTRYMLEELAALIDERDSYTGGHSRRVSGLAALLARELRLRVEQTETIIVAAGVHDIGKIQIPIEVLRKEAPLTEDEWRIIKLHPVLGADLLMTYPGFQEIADIVGAHHERWDGRGYPAGLRGQAIPLGARIIAVADSFDAMISDRSYRRARSIESAAQTLWRERGLQWEPVLVEAFLSAIGPILPRWVANALPLSAARDVATLAPRRDAYYVELRAAPRCRESSNGQ